ncbi:hypothetical protein H8356DRAFT_1674297 [Neocallimastix lanati (nom. inval.)]|nr:hypothetical protein H8356DRAFT_1674297 [Neocallimastix sp. JGI-2020a]
MKLIKDLFFFKDRKIMSIEAIGPLPYSSLLPLVLKKRIQENVIYIVKFYYFIFFFNISYLNKFHYLLYLLFYYYFFYYIEIIKISDKN